MSNKNILRIITGTTLCLALHIAPASAATGLPGGASSLYETYGNWTVSCLVQKQGEAQKVLCSMSSNRLMIKDSVPLPLNSAPIKAVHPAPLFCHLASISAPERFCRLMKRLPTKLLHSQPACQPVVLYPPVLIQRRQML